MHLIWDQDIVCSNQTTPTIFLPLSNREMRMLYKTNIEGFEEIECRMVEPLEAGTVIMIFKQDLAAPSYSIPVFFKIDNAIGNELELSSLTIIPCRKHKHD